MLNSITCPETKSRKYEKSSNNRLVSRIDKEFFQKNNKKIKIPNKMKLTEINRNFTKGNAETSYRHTKYQDS